MSWNWVLPQVLEHLCWALETHVLLLLWGFHHRSRCCLVALDPSQRDMDKGPSFMFQCCLSLEGPVPSPILVIIHRNSRPIFFQKLLWLLSPQRIASSFNFCNDYNLAHPLHHFITFSLFYLNA